MELTSLILIAIALVYITKNEKGRKVLDHAGNTAVHLAASADKASAALEKQCDELLAPEAPEAKAELKAKLVKKSIDDYDDAEEHSTSPEDTRCPWGFIFSTFLPPFIHLSSTATRTFSSNITSPVSQPSLRTNFMFRA